MRTEEKTNMNELEELRRRIAELEHSEANRKRAWEALQASEVWYRTLAESLPGIVYRVYIRESNRMQFFNNMLPTMTGYEVEELEGSQVCSLESLIVPEDRTDVMATVKNAIMEDKPFEVEYRLKHKDGRIRYFFERGRPIRGSDGKPLHIDGVILDITEHRQAEDALRKRETELEAQSHHLKEVNTALRVLLKQREEDKKDLEENVLSNVKQLVNPHIQGLKKSGLDAHQRTLVSILESNLNNIVSPFTIKLSSKLCGLTPMEIRVADFVKEGKTNKEIAELLCLSKNTILSHRFHIRSKLGLKNQKINLRTHLLSLTK